MRSDNLKCRECQASYPLGAVWFCARCFGPLQVSYDWSGLAPARAREEISSGPQSVWRYAEFLPLTAPPRGGALSVGMTPLVRAERLEARLGVSAEIWIKDETRNPTHSFKDRVVWVASAKAIELGFSELACASTGNLASAVAAAAAALGLPAHVFVPAETEEEKLLAAAAYGARVVEIDGSYDDANRICTELAGENPEWAFVNTTLRPYYAEGSKSLAYEISEQLGWRTPDRVVCPIASGSLFTKIAQGLSEWLELGMIRGGLPVFNGAQPAGCSPVARAFSEGADICRPVKPDTIAKSLAIGDPADGDHALRLARRSGGAIEAVSETEIRAGIRLLAETAGIFTETAGGVTVAVLKKLAERGEIRPGERVVVCVTGDGLKTLDAVR